MYGLITIATLTAVATLFGYVPLTGKENRYHLIFNSGTFVFAAMGLFRVNIGTVLDNRTTIRTMQGVVTYRMPAMILVMMIFFALAYKLGGLYETRTYTTASSPWDFIYFSMITWTTVGYGDLIPASVISKLAAGIEALMGYLVMALYLAALLRMATMEQDIRGRAADSSHPKRPKPRS